MRQRDPEAFVRLSNSKFPDAQALEQAIDAVPLTPDGGHAPIPASTPPAAPASAPPPDSHASNRPYRGALKTATAIIDTVAVQQIAAVKPPEVAKVAAVTGQVNKVAAAHPVKFTMPMA